MRKKGKAARGRAGGRAGGPGGGQRQLRVRVAKSRSRTASSQRWLERQLNDPYVAAAQREGFRSRAAFKLKEIDDKFHVLRPGLRVVDLGAAPGGWSQIAAERVRAIGGRGQVVAIDIVEMEPIAGVESVRLDVLDDTAQETLEAMLRGGGAGPCRAAEDLRTGSLRAHSWCSPRSAIDAPSRSNASVRLLNFACSSAPPLVGP